MIMINRTSIRFNIRLYQLYNIIMGSLLSLFLVLLVGLLRIVDVFGDSWSQWAWAAACGFRLCDAIEDEAVNFFFVGLDDEPSDVVAAS